MSTTGTCLLFVTLIGVFPVVSSFAPNTVLATFISAPSSDTHSSITNCAINRIAQEVLGPTANRTYSCVSSLPVLSSVSLFTYFRYLNSRDLVRQQNVRVDRSAATKDDPSFHFDAEMFENSNNQMIDRKLNALSAMKNGNYHEARLLVGQLLHALQDFYSHSNWIEMNKQKPHAFLARTDQIGRVADPQQDTCLDCSTSYGECRDNIIATLNEGEVLTSGYYSDQIYNGQSVPKPKTVSKCSHGGTFDGTRLEPAIGGINKDANGATWSPHWYLHDQASFQAQAATFELLKDLWDAAGDSRFRGFLALDASRTVAIVLDRTTYSGGDSLLRLAKLADEIDRRDGNQISFILSPFDDSSYGPVTTAANSEAFRRVLQSISSKRLPHPIGAPGMCLHALMDAIQSSPFGSQVSVFTDAAAGDPELFELVLAVAVKKAIAVSFFLIPLPQQFLRAAPASAFELYRTLAYATGGSVVHTSHALHLEERILRAAEEPYDTLLHYTSIPGSDQKTVYNFTVDHAIDKLIVQVAPHSVSSSAVVTVIGQALKEQVHEQGANFSFTGEQPSVGPWSVAVQCDSAFDLHVYGESNVSIAIFLSSTVYGDRIQGQPRVGARSQLWVDVLYADRKVEIDDVVLISEAGLLLNTSAARKVTDEEFYGNVTIPSSSFRVQVNGRFAGGDRFQRMSALYYPTQLEVGLGQTDDSMVVRPNKLMVVPLTVINHGDADTVTIAVNDFIQQDINVSVSSSSAQLAKGQRFDGTISVRSSADPKPEPFLLTVTVKTSSWSNFLQVEIPVAPLTYDHQLPAVRLSKNNVTCPTSTAPACESFKWNVSVTFQDASVGLERVFIRSYPRGAPTFRVDPFDKGTTALVHGIIEANCCVRYVEVIAVDVGGHVGRDFVDSDSYEPENASAKKNVSIQLLLAAALLAVVAIFKNEY